jgi:hypothetical protein
MTLLWVRLSYQSHDSYGHALSGTAECSKLTRLSLNWFCFEYPDIPNHQRIPSDRVYPGQA